MRLIGYVMMFFLSGPVVARPPLRGGMVGMPELNSSIVRAADAYQAAVLAGDAAGVAALYREDAVEMPPCEPAVDGRQAIEQHYRDLFKGSARITAFTLVHSESTAAGEVGYDVGTYRQTLWLSSGASIEETGKFTVIVKRTDRDWKIAYAIYNSDRPPMAPALAPER